MISTDTIKLVRKYIRLITWFYKNEDSKDITVEQFEVVLNEIGGIETQLNQRKVSNDAIEKIIQMAKEHCNKPLSEMSESEQTKILQNIFG